MLALNIFGMLFFFSCFFLAIWKGEEFLRMSWPAKIVIAGGIWLTLFAWIMIDHLYG